MKKFDKNPFVWFLAAIFLGSFAVRTGHFEFFVVLISAAILAKQIEILSK